MEQIAPAPHRGWRIAAILSLVVVTSAVAVNLSTPYAMDFISYWAAGRLTLAGDPAAAWDIARHHAVQAGAVAEPTIMPFPYPPPFLFAVTPFALLPFPWAAAAWIVATLAFYLFAVRRLVPGLTPLAIAFPPVMVCGIVGQNAFLLAGLFVLAMAMLPVRPIAAGVLIGLLAVKPQLGLLIPLALIAGREWRAFATAAATVAATALASLMLFGWASWQGFFDLIPLYGRIAEQGLVGWHKMASVYAALRLTGLPHALALGVHLAVLAIAALTMWRAWRVSSDCLVRGAALAIASVLISPYLYVYDQLLLIVALAWALRAGVSQAVVAALCLIPLICFALIAFPSIPLTPAPLLPIALLVLLWPYVWGSGARSGATNPRRAATENSSSAL